MPRLRKSPRKSRRKREIRKPPIDHDRWGRLCELSLVIATVGSVMALGTLHTWPLFALVGISLAVVFTATRASPTSRIPGPAWVCVGLAAFSALQAVPLPAGFVALVAPANADIWARALEPIGQEGAGWIPLSLDPGASLREACRWFSYAGIVHGACIVSERRSPAWPATLLFASGIALAVITALHGLSGTTKVWGFYEPGFPVKPWHVGPILNPNSLAGYLTLAFLAGAGLVVARRDAGRWAILVGMAVLAAVGVLSASRGGVVVMLFGVLVFSLVHWRREKRRRFPRILLGAAAVLCAGLALALLGGSSGIWSELFDDNLEKLSMAEWVWPMVEEHAWVGVGRGAFESVSPAYQPTAGHVRFTHAEIFPLHWAAEWGVLVTVAALGAFAWTLRPSRLRAIDGPALGMLVGVVVLLIQNFADLGLEIPGVMVAVAVAVGAIRRDDQRRGEKAAFPFWPVVAAAALFLLPTLLFGRQDLTSDVKALSAQARKTLRVKNVDGFRESLSAAIRRHPAEPHFALLGALVAYDTGDPAVMAWIQRALERGDENGRTHLLLARVLADHGVKHQALMELRIATERDPALVHHTARTAIAIAPTQDELMRVVPEGPNGVRSLNALAIALYEKDRDLALSMDREALSRDPEAAPAMTRIASTLVRQLKDEETACGRDAVACRVQIEGHIAELARLEPDMSSAARVSALLGVVDGNAAEATAQLLARCDDVKDRRICFSSALSAAAEAGDAELVAEAGERLLAESCSTAEQCAATASRVGDLQARGGHWHAAMLFYRRALAEEETGPRLIAYAQAARRVGENERARQALERASTLNGARKQDIEDELKALTR